MNVTIFALDQDRLGNWEPPNADVLEPDWDPVEHGSENDIVDLVYQAHQAGVIRTLFAEGWRAEVAYSYSDDLDGGGYLWTLDLETPDLKDYNRLRLASSWHEQRKIVPVGMTGRDAVAHILEAATDEGNALFAHLLRWFPSDPMQLLTITHRHGTDATIYADETGVHAALFDWVSTYWDDEGPDWPIPEDEHEAVKDYFEHHPNEDWGAEEILVPHVFHGAIGAIKEEPPNGIR